MALQAWPKVGDAFSSLDDFVLQCFRYAASSGDELRALVRQPDRAYLGCALPPASNSKRMTSKTCCFRLTARPREGDGVRVTAVSLDHDCSPTKRSAARRSGEAAAKMLSRLQRLEDEIEATKQSLKESPSGRSTHSSRIELECAEPEEPWRPKRFSSLEAFQTSCEAYARHHHFWLFGRRVPQTGEFRFVCSEGRDRPGPARADACPFMLCAVETASGRTKLSKSYLEHNHELAPPALAPRAHTSPPQAKSRRDARSPSDSLRSRSTPSSSAQQTLAHFTSTPFPSIPDPDSAPRLTKRIRLSSAISSSHGEEDSQTEMLAVYAALLPFATPRQLDQLANDLRALGVETGDDLCLLRLLDASQFGAFLQQHSRYVHASPELAGLLRAISASTLPANGAKAS